MKPTFDQIDKKILKDLLWNSGYIQNPVSNFWYKLSSVKGVIPRYMTLRVAGQVAGFIRR